MNVYLDNAASTMIDTRVLESMLPYLKENYGNPSSTHKQGKLLKVLIEDTRDFIASYFSVKPKEIFFTSGGTESNNFAIKGFAFSNKTSDSFITSTIEHPAVLDSFKYIQTLGYDVEYIKPGFNGVTSVEMLEEQIKDNTRFVSLMHANNELGSINDLKSLSVFCKNRGIVFHSDTVQSVGKVIVKPKESGIDFLTVSAHKIYGPKGIGILYIDENIKIDKYQHGGGQERNMRGGTENAASIAGMKKAFEILSESLSEEINHYINLKNFFLSELESNFRGKYIINGSVNNSLPNIVNVSFLPDKFNSPSTLLPILLDLNDISVSGGSACSSGSLKPSNVLLELGIPENVAMSTIRVSFGRFNKKTDLSKLIMVLKEILEK